MRPGILLVVLVLWTLPLAAGKEPVQVRPQPANTYAAHDSHEGVAIAAEPYDKPEKSKAVFGKHDPLKIGILPVFLVITNNTQDAVRLDDLQVQFISGDRRRAEAIPAMDVSLRLKGRRPPPQIDASRKPLPIPRLPQRRDPGAIPEIVDREFLLKMVPPGDTVGGFFFFPLGLERNPLSGARLYLPGITWARTGRPLLFFEISFDDYLKGR